MLKNEHPLKKKLFMKIRQLYQNIIYIKITPKIIIILNPLNVSKMTSGVIVHILPLDCRRSFIHICLKYTISCIKFKYIKTSIFSRKKTRLSFLM